MVDAEAAAGAHIAYADLVDQATDRTPEPGEIEAMSAYEMAATVEFGLDAKQGLLDLRSETARLKLVTRLCRAAIKRLDFIDRAQARRVQRQGPLHGRRAVARVGLLDLGVRLCSAASERRVAALCFTFGSAPASSSACAGRVVADRDRGVDRAHAGTGVGVGVRAGAGGEDRPHRLRPAEERRQVQRREAVAAAGARSAPRSFATSPSAAASSGPTGAPAASSASRASGRRW